MHEYLFVLWIISVRQIPRIEITGSEGVSVFVEGGM